MAVSPSDSPHLDTSSERLEPSRIERVDPESLPPEPQASRLDASIWDPHEAVRAAANRELHADLLATSVRRLSTIAGFGGAAFALYWAAVRWLMPHTASGSPGFVDLASLLLGIGVLMSGALYAITKLKFRPAVVTDLGYAYLFGLSLLLGLLRHAEPFAPHELVRQLSPVVLPILAFGALIPAQPRKALAVSLGAAAMDPLALFMRKGHLAYGVRETLLLLASPLLAALLAYQISRVVHRLSEGIAKAREIGSYRLLQRLGAGGMAEVWRAQHRMLARPAAVKLIRPQVLARSGSLDAARLLRLFTREARTTASLGSPHTIQVYDFGVTREGAFYYVMELLDGVDLQSLVERYGVQPSERVAHLLIQACHSLAEAHERDFVHRDIKPANIFSCRLGGDYDFAKVLDFGLVFDQHPTAEELEDERRLVGTASVMAPEMVRFQSPVDARADIYALGCVGYWLLTGKRVFEASNRHDMLIMHAHQKPVLPSKRVEARVHPGLEELLMACLEKNPNRRPQTARELAESLAALRFAQPWTAERARLWWQHQFSAARPSSLPPSAPELESDGAAARPELDSARTAE